jgi:protein tyrosine phosphatase
MNSANSSQIYDNELNTIGNYNYHSFIADKGENIDKNRYVDIFPFDYNIVKLSDNEYINASWINYMNKKYIATQAPLKNTVNDFWNMIWEHNVKNIVMLTNDANTAYWPTNINNKLSLNKYNITLLGTKQIDNTIILNILSVKYKNIKRVILHYKYNDWPDHKCPNNIDTFLTLINSVNDELTCVHCTAGVGRTGTYITIDIILKMLNDNMDSEINIPNIIRNLRKQRYGMIQTASQLKFCYDVLKYKKII